MHRLQPVAGIRQRARHDHAHGVVEVGAAHLLLDGHRLGVLGVTGGNAVWGVAQTGLDSVVRTARAGMPDAAPHHGGSDRLIRAEKRGVVPPRRSRNPIIL